MRTHIFILTNKIKLFSQGMYVGLLSHHCSATITKIVHSDEKCSTSQREPWRIHKGLNSHALTGPCDGMRSKGKRSLLVWLRAAHCASDWMCVWLLGNDGGSVGILPRLRTPRWMKERAGRSLLFRLVREALASDALFKDFSKGKGPGNKRSASITPAGKSHWVCYRADEIYAFLWHHLLDKVRTPLSTKQPSHKISNSNFQAASLIHFKTLNSKLNKHCFVKTVFAQRNCKFCFLL